MHHFQIKTRPLLDALLFNILSIFTEPVLAFDEFCLDCFNGAQDRFTRRHIMRTRINRETGYFLQHLAGQGIKKVQAFYLVIEHLDPERIICIFRREDINRISPNPEGTPAEIDVVPAVLHLHQSSNHITVRYPVPLAQRQNHLVILVRITDTVNRRDRCNNHDITTFHQRLGTRQAHLFDVLVDRRIFLDKQIPLGNVSFRLVIIVITDEILDGIIREKLPELTVQLRRQRFIGRKNDSRPTEARNHIGHRIRLPRPRYAQKCLERQTVFDSFNQFVDCLRLVTGR